MERQLPRRVPVPRPPGERLRRRVVVGAGVTRCPAITTTTTHDVTVITVTTTTTVASGWDRRCSTSAATSVPSWRRCHRRRWAPSCSSGRPTTRRRPCTPACGSVPTPDRASPQRSSSSCAHGTYHVLDEHGAVVTHGRGPRWQRGHRGPPRLTPPPPTSTFPPRSGEGLCQTPTRIFPRCADWVDL